MIVLASFNAFFDIDVRFKLLVFFDRQHGIWIFPKVDDVFLRTFGMLRLNSGIFSYSINY